MKKTLNLLMVMLLTLAAGSFLMMGCSNPTDGSPGLTGGAGAPGTAALTGTISATGLQSVVDSGKPIVIVGPATIGAGYVDLKGVTITVAASLTVNSGAVLNAIGANFLIDGGSMIVASGAIIIIPQTAPGWVDDPFISIASGTLAADVPSGDIAGTAGNILAVRDYTLTDTPADIPAAKRVAVYGTLTIPSTAEEPAGYISAIGKVDFTGDNSALTTGRVNFTYATITTSKAGGVTISTSGAFSGSFDIESGKDITLEDVIVYASVSGAGTLKLSKAVVAAQIGGTGNVAFTGTTVNAPTSLVAAISASATFSSTVGFSGASSSVLGTVTFADNVTIGAEAVTVSNATFTSGKTLTFGGAGVLTIPVGGAVKVGSDTVLSAYDISGYGISLSIGGTAGVLAFGSNKIRAGTAAVTVGGTYVAAILSGELDTAEANGIVLSVPLALVDGAKLTTSSTGTIDFAGYNFSGVGSWTASFAEEAPSDAVIFLDGDAIIGTTPSQEPVAGVLTASSTSPTLTVPAGSGSPNVVALSSVEIALAGNGAKVGTLVLGWHATEMGVIVFQEGSKISTALAAATVKSTLLSTLGAIGTKLELYSTAASGGTKFGYIAPAADTTETQYGDASSTVWTAPTSSADATIDGSTVVNS
jgi:hypothetical protein